MYNVDHFTLPLGLQLLGNEVEVKPVNFSRPPTHTLPLSETCTPSRPSPPDSLTPSPPPTNHAPHSTTPRQTPTNVEALTPTPPPPAAIDESVSPAPVLLPAQSSDVSTTLPRPVAQPATVTSGKVGLFPSSLTPSPDLPETPLHQQALLKEQFGEINGTLNTPQQSGPGFESAQSSFQPPTSSHNPSVVEQPPSHSTAAVDEPSKKAPLRKLSGGSTGSRESIRTKPSASHKGADPYCYTYALAIRHLFAVFIHINV